MGNGQIPVGSISGFENPGVVGGGGCLSSLLGTHWRLCVSFPCNFRLSGCEGPSFQGERASHGDIMRIPFTFDL